MLIIFDSHLVILPKEEKKKNTFFSQLVHSREDLISLENRFLKYVILNDWHNGMCRSSVHSKILESMEAKYMNFEIGLCVLNLNHAIY